MSYGTKTIADVYQPKLQLYVQRHCPTSRDIVLKEYEVEQRALKVMENASQQNSFNTRALSTYIKKLIEYDAESETLEHLRRFNKDKDDRSKIELHNRDKQFMDTNVLQTLKLRNSDSPCLFIKRSKDGRLQVGGQKQHPVLMYCRLFRWPGITKNAINPLPQCRMHVAHCNHIDNNGELVCVNVYHYEKSGKKGNNSAINSLQNQQNQQLNLLDDAKRRKSDAFPGFGQWVPLDPPPQSWSRFRYFEFDILKEMRNLQLKDFADSENTPAYDIIEDGGENYVQTLKLDSYWTVDCTNPMKSIIGLSKLSHSSVSLSTRIRTNLAEGVTITRDAKHHRLKLEINSPGVAVFVQSFWLDFEYCKRNSGNMAAAYGSAGKDLPQFVHKFKYCSEENDDKVFKAERNLESGFYNTGLVRNEHVIFDLQDFSGIMKQNFEKRYLIQEDLMSDGDGEDFVINENIDKDQMVADCRIQIGFMKGFGDRVIHWHKGSSSFSQEPSYNRDSIECTPCWVRFDLIEALRLCERERRAYLNNKQLYRDKFKNQQQLFQEQQKLEKQKNAAGIMAGSMNVGVNDNSVSDMKLENFGQSRLSLNKNLSEADVSEADSLNVNYLPNIDVNEVENYLESGYGSSSCKPDNMRFTEDFFEIENGLKKEFSENKKY